MGTADDFRRLRDVLTAARYTEAGLVEDGGINTGYEFPSMASGRRTTFMAPVDTQSLLVHLFLDGHAIPWTTIDAILSPSERAAFDALGLLQPSVADPTQAVGTVALYPLEGLYMISDRYGGLQVIGTGSPADLVYSALTPEAHRFVELMPRIPARRHLDLCSGCGVAALISASQFADDVVAVDITSRSTRFAEFNVRLNALSNLAALEGNLYEPVAGRQFDLITAHPPYVASFGTEMIFRDAGEDGEQVSRAILAGLADHLAPGGQFYCDCTMTDREGAPLEHRIREMLGPRQDEFDVVVAQASATNPVLQYAGAVFDDRSTPELYLRRVAAFKRLAITSFVSAVIVVQRRRTNRPVVTQRRILTGRTTAAHFQWLLRYLVTTSTWTEADVIRLLDSTPRTMDGVEWRTRMYAEGSVWKLGYTQLATFTPFAIEADDGPPWLQHLLAWCDGKTTARELLGRLRQAGAIHEANADQQFATLIRRLADNAFIELPEFPIPSKEKAGLDADRARHTDTVT
jgi:SAM-dependent methyltransferase